MSDQKEKAANDIMEYLKSHPSTTTENISKDLKLDHTIVVGVCKSLEIKGAVQNNLKNVNVNSDKHKIGDTIRIIVILLLIVCVIVLSIVLKIITEHIAFLKKTNGGRATFLPLDTVQKRTPSAVGPDF